MTPSLLSALCALYASEIKVSICISSFWGEGWEVKLGDTVNGFAADKTFANAEPRQLCGWPSRRVCIIPNRTLLGGLLNSVPQKVEFFGKVNRG
jgi:hypothetical protein